MNDLRERVDRLLQIKKSTKLMLAETALCKLDIIHFVNNWCWTYDPREEIKHLPFNLYDYQAEALLWLEERFQKNEIGIIEKSRDMGVSWLLTVWSLHKFLFFDGTSQLFGSRIQDDVDDKTHDSLFGKIRYNIDRLPYFLKPDMHKRLSDGNEADRYLTLIHPESGNEIVGSSTNDNFGRGGRKSIVFLDEFAFVEHSDRIWSAVRDVSDCIIPVSTPNGKGNMFAKLRKSGNVPVLTLHWKRHPKKNLEWYEKRKEDMEPWQIAQELDIDYDASKSGRVYKQFNKAYHVAEEPIRQNPDLEQFITWDFGVADSMTMIFGQIDAEDQVEIYDSLDLTGQDIEFFLPLTMGQRPPFEQWSLLSEREQKRILDLLARLPKNVRYDHYGDFAGTQRTANSRRSVRDRMREQPWKIELICTRNQAFPNRIQCLANLLKLRKTQDGGLKSRFKISPHCEGVIDAFLNYEWNSEDIDNPNIKPKHNWASHYMSSLEFFAINRFPLIKRNDSEIVRVR